MFTRLQVCEKLSVCEATVSNLPEFPAMIDSQYLGNRAYYRKDDVYKWLINVIDKRNDSKAYEGDIQNEQLIRLKELTKLLRVSKSHVYKQVQLGTLPQPVKLGHRASAWLLSEVNQVLSHNGPNDACLD
ncbi:hypothetical protein JCM19239_2786 [Vibrio variabilis]|uniref:AlpA family transcriptional regulator n=1 Tax=Vibrio variabilis TaxID=990271 RepID=A0ABQ0JQ18_9VIBR|nr:hypothetical protein JCM19239_2786 [Vibrio variabilis]